MSEAAPKKFQSISPRQAELESFSLETLKVVNPDLVKAFERLLQQCVVDCMDRPGLNKACTVKMTISLTPDANPNTNAIDCVSVGINLNSSVPGQDAPMAVLNIKDGNTGELGYHPTNPSDARQGGLFNHEETEGGDS